MKNIYKLLGIIALVAVIGFSFAACGGDGSPSNGLPDDGSPDNGSPDDPPPVVYSTLTITNFGSKLPKGKFLVGYDDDADMFFAINADEYAVLITGNTLTLKVYDNDILFTGTKTLGAGKLYLLQVSAADLPRTVEKTFINTAPIEFINGSATINMSTQMEEEI